MKHKKSIKAKGPKKPLRFSKGGVASLGMNFPHALVVKLDRKAKAKGFVRAGGGPNRNAAVRHLIEKWVG